MRNLNDDKTKPAFSKREGNDINFHEKFLQEKLEKIML